VIFPTVGEVATPVVVMIQHKATLGEALREMREHDIRDIVIAGERSGEYGLFTINDLIRHGTSLQGLDHCLDSCPYQRLHTVEEVRNVLEVFAQLEDDQQYIGVVNAEQELVGLLSHTDIISSIDPQLMIEKQRVGDIFDKVLIKTAETTTPIGNVLLEMSTIDDAVIIVEKGLPVGILTTKDAVRLLDEGVNQEAPASAHMTAPIETFNKKMTVKAALDLLKNRKYKRLVVTDDNNRLVGVITQKELVAMAYNRWAELLRSHAAELHEIVDLLEKRTERLEYLASTDPLTRAYNRNKFEQVLEAEIGRFYRYKSSPFAVMMLDIDHFKQINDRYGHLSGDEALKGISQAIREHVRDTDLFARWGGEEFILLLPHTDGQEALLFAERLREMVQALQIAPLPSLTVSIGVAEYRENDSMETLLERADQALYRAKEEGRNRVRVAS
jgi:diguanylate cyclase (GGDEF)-like protein